MEINKIPDPEKGVLFEVVLEAVVGFFIVLLLIAAAILSVGNTHLALLYVHTLFSGYVLSIC